MPGAGPVPLEHGQGKAGVCSAVCAVSLAQGAGLCPSCLQPGRASPGAVPSFVHWGTGLWQQLPASRDSARTCTGSLCAGLCSRALEAGSSFQVTRLSPRAGRACVFHLCEPVSVPACAGRQSSLSLVLELLQRRAQQREPALRSGFGLGRDSLSRRGAARLPLRRRGL